MRIERTDQLPSQTNNVEPRQRQPEKTGQEESGPKGARIGTPQLDKAEKPADSYIREPERSAAIPKSKVDPPEVHSGNLQNITT